MQAKRNSMTYAGAMAVGACAVLVFAINVFGADKESDLIAILQSPDAKPAEKAITCKKLVVCGTKASVPALAAFLSDEKLASWARIGLEAIPDPAVDEALRDAMGKLQGRLLIGVINSISRRGDVKAVDALVKKTKDADVGVASAAVAALGCIDGDEAIETVEKMLPRAKPELVPAVCEACLKCADSLAANGKHDRAAALCKRVLDAQVPPYIRMMAMRNLIVAKQADGIPLLIEQLKGNDTGMTAVALGLAHTIPGPALTKALASEVGSLPAEKQVYVIDALGCRNDKSVVPTLLGLAKSASGNVCIAAVGALSKLGDPAALPTLIDIAASGDSDVAKSALVGLAAFPSAEADNACAALLTAKEAGRRVVGVDVLNRRGSTSAVPAVQKAAMEDADESTRIACINLLRELGRIDNIPVLVEILLKNRSSDEVQAVEKAIATICTRQTDMGPCADMLIPGLPKAQPAQKNAILRILRSVGDAKSLKAVRAAMSDPNAEIKDNATRLICDWNAVDAAPDMLDLAKNSANNSYKLLALRGYIRVSGGKDVADGQKLAMCKEASALIQRDDERKLLLGVLGTAENAESFQMAASYLDNAALKDEACIAAVAIAEKLPKGKSAEVVPVMEKVLKTTRDGELINRAKAVIKKAK